VARAFDYLVPPELAADVGVGTIVRVGLHGRRVRGWVVADGVEPEAAADRLVPLHAVVSAGPPADVVELCRWVAWRWAGPLSTVLRTASAPNVVAPGPAPELDIGIYAGISAGVDAGAADGPLALPEVRVRSIAWPPAADPGGLVELLLGNEGSTIVVVPEPAHAARVRAAVARSGREIVELHAGQPDALRTAAWSEARRGARVVIGGRTAVFAPVPDLTAVVVLDDGDEALQEERAPTWHARDIAAERSARTGARLAMVSPVPTIESLQLAGPPAPVGPDPLTARQGWPALDVVDLRDEPPGTGLVSEVFASALHRALDGGGRVVCVVNRKGRARLLACRTCGELARCAKCDSAVVQPERDLVCPRCATTRPPVCLECHGSTFRIVHPGVAKLRDDVAGLVPRVAVVEVDARTGPVPDVPVLVGTEAVLHRIPAAGAPVRLVAFLEFDQELLAPRTRAVEQALWLLARAARLVGGRRAGGRVLVQTRVPDHEVLRSAATGDLAELLDGEADRRRTLGFPPFGGLAELSGAEAAVVDASAALRTAGVEGLQVLGPSAAGRTLVLAPSPEALADAFAGVDLAPARSRGRLRVAVDPPRI
jgi:primosomal protein N' (replication factor Y)